jgi:predicted DNA-binding protein
MSNTLTVRLSEDLAKWLDDVSRQAGVAKGHIVRDQLERARAETRGRFMRLAGKVDGPPDLSMRKGFSKR